MNIIRIILQTVRRITQCDLGSETVNTQILPGDFQDDSDLGSETVNTHILPGDFQDDR